MDRIKLFFKNNWKTITVVIILFLLGFRLFHTESKLEKLNKTIIEKEFENKQLEEKLKNQEEISGSLKLKVDSLKLQWENTSKEKIEKDIKSKYDEKRNIISDANLDEQLSIFSKRFPQKSNSK